jgi:hypothetical protein
MEEEEYEYLEIPREESDASSDEQEELGLFSGPVSDCYTLGVERNPRVSKGFRKQVQFNPPSGSHMVKKFPEHGNTVRPTGQSSSITQGPNLNSNQFGPTKRITPFDVHKNEFKGKDESQFIPMEVDQGVSEILGDKGRQGPTNRFRGKVIKPPNFGPTPEEVSNKIIQHVLKESVTVPLGDVIDIAPTVRRGLLNALKGTYGAVRQTGKEMEDQVVEKKVLGSSAAPQPLLDDSEETRVSKPSEEATAVMMARDDLPTVAVRIGRARVKGVFDSGSQVNVLSEKFMRQCGLPVQTENLHRYRISGIDGGPAECVGVIPNAKIYLTESELPTVGDLVVVRDAVFDLLLGRPWGTGNAAGIREEKEGTYLNFRSKGGRYEVNVAPNPHYLQRHQVGLASLTKPLEKPRQLRAIAAVTRKEYVSESEQEGEEEQEKEGEEEQEKGEEEQEEGEINDPETQRNSNEAEYGSEAEKENTHPRLRRVLGDLPDSEEERETDTQPPLEDISSSSSEEEYGMEIESEFQEKYIKLVQKGANEEEWETFCAEEKKRLKQDEDQWEEWKRSTDQDGIPEGTMENSQTQPQDLADSPQTLTMTQPTQKVPKSRKHSSKPEERSLATGLKRIQRVRKESKKARESEEWQKIKRRAYERAERITRKTVKGTNCSATPKILASLALAQAPGEIQESNVSNSSENEDEREESGKGSRNEEDLPEHIAPGIHPFGYPPTKMDQQIAIWRTFEHFKKINKCGRISCDPIDEHIPRDWRIGPREGVIEIRRKYPWIPRKEIAAVLSSVRRLPNNEENIFDIHTVTEDGMEIALAPSRDTDLPVQRSEKYIVLLMRRGTGNT